MTLLIALLCMIVPIRANDASSSSRPTRTASDISVQMNQIADEYIAFLSNKDKKKEAERVTTQEKFVAERIYADRMITGNLFLTGLKEWQDSPFLALLLRLSETDRAFLIKRLIKTEYTQQEKQQIIIDSLSEIYEGMPPYLLVGQMQYAERVKIVEYILATAVQVKNACKYYTGVCDTYAANMAYVHALDQKIDPKQAEDAAQAVKKIKDLEYMLKQLLELHRRSSILLSIFGQFEPSTRIARSASSSSSSAHSQQFAEQLKTEAKMARYLCTSRNALGESPFFLELLKSAVEWERTGTNKDELIQRLCTRMHMMSDTLLHDTQTKRSISLVDLNDMRVKLVDWGDRLRAGKRFYTSDGHSADAWKHVSLLNPDITAWASQKNPAEQIDSFLKMYQFVIATIDVLLARSTTHTTAPITIRVQGKPTS